MSEEEVLNALRALAESDREKEASRAVEIRLRSAFQKKYKRRSWWTLAVPALAATAAAVVVLVVKLEPAPQTMQIAVAAPPVAVVPVAAALTVQPTPARRPKPQPREVATDFFPLMDAPLPFDQGELLRVSVPASAMRIVGLPVREDRLTEMVQADVLVGEEGLARAIRFVRFEN
jgi:hypothetical protein